MAEETELDVLKEIRSGVGGINTRLSSTNEKLDSVIALLTELRGAVVDVRNKVSDVKIVKLYTGKNPVGTSEEVHAERSEQQFTELYNSGYRVIAELGSDQAWATLVMGKYPAPNTAKK